MSVPNYGFTFQRQQSQVLPAFNIDMSSVYLVGISDDAVESVFPLYTTVEINSADTLALAALGTGDLLDSVRLINAQLGPRQVAARIGIHRVPGGSSEAEAIVNILGNQANGTGLYGALTVGQTLTFTPRLIMIAGGYTGRNLSRSAAVTIVTQGAKFGGNAGTGLLTLAGPAYGADHQLGVYRVRCTGGAKTATAAAKATGNTGTGVVSQLSADADTVRGKWRLLCTSAAANAGTFAVLRPDGSYDGVAQAGAAYDSAHGPNFTITDGATDFVAGDEFVLTVVDAVPANGGTFSVIAPNGAQLADAVVGVAYAGSHVRFTIADGVTDYAIGDGFDVLVTQQGGVLNGSPLVAALPQIESALQAHSVVDGPNTANPQDTEDFRATIASDHTILVDFSVTPSWKPAGVYVAGAAAAIGIGIRVDFQNRGLPCQSWANQAIYGITALKRYDSFSLTDGSTTGQQLLALQVGVAERGNAGDPNAVADSGFILVAYDNCGNEPEWQHFNVTRMRDYIHLGMQKLWRSRIGKSNITVKTIQAVENDGIRFLSDLKGDEAIIDFRFGINPEVNSASKIEAGIFRLYFKAEEAGPLLRLDIDSFRFPEALDGLIAQVAGETNTLVGTTN